MIARRRRAARPTLVPLIDVLFIMLIYFMVTSIYRDLNMIPVLGGAETPAAGTAAAPGETLLIRVAADGRAVLRGAALTEGDLARAQGARVLVLPSPEAPLSGLVTVLDRLSAAGLRDVELVRLEARP
ncbi:ExbD/TolR family protein [Jannaschia seohaensis]|uniref:Biopolymer transport protein ExbD n=1 Tax=Jannaschia seohaensis TaxID=475081 RepID=A0A2Y9C8E4_9RHOB|nr:biopolymer transporter ExbD [Jannaschia seohaensis]PWJ16566.1 biopolymer transport protein ExbD [Jannaschia seohaensis]SSA48803.1 biopolymer transport protein ExbD [Jannaschia seohaensis]